MLSGLLVFATVSIFGIIEQPVRGSSLVSDVARLFDGTLYPVLSMAALLTIPTSAFLIALRRHGRTGFKVIAVVLVSQLMVLGWEVSFVEREPPLKERYQRWLKEA